MLISKALGINNEGNLTIGGADTTVLAKTFKTPLYVLDEKLIVENIASYRDAIRDYYGGHGMVCYASKAFSCKEMARIAMREKIGMDVVSGGELYTAMSVDFPMSKIVMHGNNKDFEELQMAIEKGVGRIVADSYEEMEIINSIGKATNKKPKVLLRIKPGVDAHTHEFIMTGHNDCKFGVALEGGEAFEAMEKANRLDSIELCGIHGHIGSQIFEQQPFVHAAKLLITFMAKVKNELGINLYELNLGGGFGIKYTKEDKPKPYALYMKDLLEAVIKKCGELSFDLPFVIVEPGRSIVGAAGITLYNVGEIKDIPGVRKYVSVNGGMADNPRYIMYGAEYDALLCTSPFAERTEKITIAGKCCESGDILIKDIMMPSLKRGDLVSVLSTGAYNYSMSSNYNRLAKPAVVMVRDGVPRIIVKRENYEDIIRNDV